MQLVSGFLQSLQLFSKETSGEAGCCFLAGSIASEDWAVRTLNTAGAWVSSTGICAMWGRVTRCLYRTRWTVHTLEEKYGHLMDCWERLEYHPIEKKENQSMK